MPYAIVCYPYIPTSTCFTLTSYLKKRTPEGVRLFDVTYPKKPSFASQFPGFSPVSVIHGARTSNDISQYALVLFVADILGLRGIKHEVADRRYQTVNTKGDRRQEQVASRSGRIALRLQGSVIDDKASDPSKEKR